MIARRSFIAGLIASPVLVRASSLDFVPRDFGKIHTKKWWWNPRPMCGQDIGFFYGSKPRGFGWSGLDSGFHSFPHGSVRSIDPATFNTHNQEGKDK